MKPLSDRWTRLLPGLGHAHTVIRHTRSEQYFTDWDRLTNSWLPIFAIPPDVGPVAGANIGTGIDQLFERCDTEEETHVLFDALQALTSPVDAAALVSSMKRIAETGPGLKEAVQMHVAILTSVGYDTLAGSGEGLTLANDWLTLWQEALATQNSQQVAHTWAASHLDNYPSLLTTFEEGVSEYQRRFGWTETLAVSTIAAFPFSPHSSRMLLYHLHELLRLTAPFFRLVCDVTLDSSESMNAGLFAAAAERGCSIADMRAELLQDASAAITLQRRMHTVAEQRLQEYLISSRNLTGKLPKGSIQSMLIDFCGVVERVAMAEIDRQTR